MAPNKYSDKKLERSKAGAVVFQHEQTRESSGDPVIRQTLS